jgi:hypothetical protein
MAFTRGYALIIGVGSYRFAPHLNVPITAADAEAVATALRDPRLCGYPDANVTLLANEGATRDGVLAALRTLAQRTTPADTVLLFYSGHGEYSADGTYMRSPPTTPASIPAVRLSPAPPSVRLT